MAFDWKAYQEDTAAFFRRLKCQAEIEAKVRGVRGEHVVDVLVTGTLHGIAFRWVVECKYWKTNVPKEKVMALIAIVQDVGADRGFLVSEIGFQSGAIRAARNTNITLSSLEDLKLEAEATLNREEVMRITGRLSDVQKRLWQLHKRTGKIMSDYVVASSHLFLVDVALDDGLEGKFPNVYAVNGVNQQLVAHDWNDLIAKITDLLDAADNVASRGETDG